MLSKTLGWKEIPIAAPTLAEWFTARARRDARRAALTYQGCTWSYGELADKSRRLAAALAASGVVGGDRVGYFAANHPHYFTLALALSRLSAILVPVNARLAHAEAATVLGDASAKVVVVDQPRIECANALQRAGIARDVYGVDTLGGLAGLDDLIAATGPPGEVQTPSQDIAMLIYTSGTTGTPKAAVVSHENLWMTAVNCLVDADVRRDDVLLLISPVSHMATWPLAMCTWLKGGHVVLQSSFSAEIFLDAVETSRVTTWAAVTPLLKMVADSPRFRDADLSTLRSIIVGGAALNDSVREAFSARGVHVRRAYGLTETGGIAALIPEEDTNLATTTSGKPLLFTDICIQDIGHGGGLGEICVRGRNVVSGYWGDEHAQDPAAQGWLHTGDVGEIDAEGHLHIRDRLKDVIKSGGENVYAADVERVLLGHPAIDEVAVIGAPHPRWLETVVAVARLRPGMSLTLAELRQFARSQLAGYKLPTALQVRDELPKDANGKIRKNLLREMLAPPDTP